MQHYIYILISKTPTRFGGVVRKIGKQEFNHASISLDENLEYTYAFARFRHNAPLLGGLVRESLDRFTLKSDIPVPVTVFRIPITECQYFKICNIINKMLDNREYVYNLFSVLLYPIFHGFSVKHAFSCIEFVSYILQCLGFLQDKKACKYKPDDLLVELKDYIYKQADIRECMTYNDNAKNYFAPFQFRIIHKSIASVCRIFAHMFALYPNILNLNIFNSNNGD